MPLKEIFAAIVMGGAALAIGALLQELIFYTHDRRQIAASRKRGAKRNP